jgi:predicted SAM-dependent methyltransferase
MMKVTLYRLVNKMLGKINLAMIPVRELNDENRLMSDYGLIKKDIVRLRESINGGFRRHLIDNNKTRWLEIGCGGTLEDNFSYIDLHPEGIVDRAFRDRYWRLDIISARDEELDKLGSFDLIRMQHVFEHFTPEDGRLVLSKCARMLNQGGYLLISTPDLRIHARTYLSGAYKNNPEMESFNKCAHRRIKEDSPDSFYFSMCAYSLLYERHLWCYDFEGLKYMLNETGAFYDILEIGVDHPFASFPFTHNRPEEDVCVLARKR